MWCSRHRIIGKHGEHIWLREARWDSTETPNSIRKALAEQFPIVIATEGPEDGFKRQHLLFEDINAASSRSQRRRLRIALQILSSTSPASRENGVAFLFDASARRTRGPFGRRHDRCVYEGTLHVGEAMVKVLVINKPVF